MQVSDQAAQDLAISGRHVGTHGLDNMAGEVGIEAAGWCGRGAVCETVGRHGERRMKMQSTEMLQLAKGKQRAPRSLPRSCGLGGKQVKAGMKV